MGVKSIAVKTDVRFEDQIERAVQKAVKELGSLDILINNASAISLFNSETLPMKQFDLMHNINIRGTYLCSKICLQYLKKSSNPHILNLSPPINLKPKWFENFTAYTIAKNGMSMCVIGMSEEYKKKQGELIKDTIKDMVIQKIGKERYDTFLKNSKFIEEQDKDTREFDF